MEISEFWKRLTLALREGRISDKQVDIAKRYNVAQPSVHKWKVGRNYPEQQKVVEMAEDAGVCVEWLYTGRGAMHPVVSVGSTDDELISLLNGLDEQDKQEVLRFVRFRIVG